MPPKAKEKSGDKAKLAAKQKVAEDKTFGLKNKNKSAKVQKYVQTVQKQVVDDPKKRTTTAEASRKDKKKAEEEKQKELAALFAVAIKQPKVPAGVDPKSIVCEFFRHGQCTKGFKCKFSHDLSVERKAAKIDLYTDQRDLDKEGEDGMDEWDQETLEKAVKEKHANENKNKPTEIICKHFIDAVERRLYGWFWKCPNGGDCKYRHALPPGYVMKSQMKELLEEEQKNKKDVSEMIEEERAKVEAKTPINEEVFKAWRAKKQVEKRRRQEEEQAERKAKGLLNGREIFMQEGFVATDDAGAAADYDREVDEEAAIKDMMARAQADQERAQAARAAEPPPEPEPSETASAAASNGAGPSTSAAPAAAPGTSLKLSEEDKAVFMDDDDDDIDEGDLEEEDVDDAELDALAAQIKGAHVSGS